MTTTGAPPRSDRLPRCYFCGSRDTMAPFRRAQRVLLLSWLLPIRWRYCRKCGRHFLDFRKPRNAPY